MGDHFEATAHRVARLTTVDAAGLPSLIPICYATDGQTIYSALDAKPKRARPTDLQRVRNILDHPEVAAAIDEALAICKEAGVPCGHPHVDSNNVEELIEKGFRWLMPAPSQSFAALQKGLTASGRK